MNIGLQFISLVQFILYYELHCFHETLVSDSQVEYIALCD